MNEYECKLEQTSNSVCPVSLFLMCFPRNSPCKSLHDAECDRVSIECGYDFVGTESDAKMEKQEFWVHAR